MGNDCRELDGNTGEKNIYLCSDMAAGLLPGDAHICLKVVDRAFYDGTDLAVCPFLQYCLDFCSRRHTALSSCGFLDSPQPYFFAVSPAFFMTVPEMFQGEGGVFGQMG